MVKPFIYDVELTSTKSHSQFTLPTAYTNDLDVIEFQFNILDDIDLTGATANVILFMKDGSFFQNDETSGVTIEGKTVKYTMKENEGNHSGTSEVQLVVLVNGPRYASPKYKFRIENGLETDVAFEIMIQTWDTLTKEARDFLDAVKDVEAARVQAESNRVDAESSRVTAETARETAETTRKEQETSRVNAETARMQQFQDMQLTQDLDTNKSYKTTLEIYNGLPRLKLEEV